MGFKTTISGRAKLQVGGPSERLLNAEGEGLSDLGPFIELLSKLSRSMYVGPFRNAITEGGLGEYFDVSIGTHFIGIWNLWKTGSVKSNNLAVQSVTDDIRRIFGFQNLDISAAMELNTLHLSIDGKPYTLREVGGGVAQFIVVLGNAAIRRPTFIFIDEPELNLHPALQTDFLTTLGRYASEGVVYATHSIGLARSTADRLYSLKPQDGHVVLKKFEQTPNYAEFVGEMSFSAFKELGFDKILLVEGVTEVKTVMQFLRLFGKEHKIVLLPLGGDALAKGGMEVELAELKRITPNIAALVDSERSAHDGHPIPQRVAFEASCKKLGFHVHLTERRGIENYFSDEAVKKIKGDKYSALQPYQLLKNAALPWDKTENWLIAAQMRASEIEGTDVGDFLKNL